MNASKKALAQAFSKWESDYRKNPKQFTTEQAARSMKPKSFGELCVDTLCRYLRKK